MKQGTGLRKNECDNQQQPERPGAQRSAAR
jgi:hypothetical protein